MNPSPLSEQQLMANASAIAGLTLGQVAADLGMPVPDNLRRDKGWIGNLLELQLGASAGSKPEQDFPELGIELKTIPIDHTGKPLETTFVCVTPLIGIAGLTWQQSNVRNKLRRVLWVPILTDRRQPPATRQIGTPFLWSPSPAEEQLLRQDWEELMEMIALGQVERITAHVGEVMQLRPKAANNKALTQAIGADGQPIMTLPRGFYLKTNFTYRILADTFGLS